MPRFARALLLALMIVSAQAGTAAASHQWKTWHFNMAGNTQEDGRSDPVGPIVDSLTINPGDDPKFVSLNEVCENQYRELMARLPPAWHGEFAETVDTDHYDGLCDDGGDIPEHDYGIAVLIRGDVVAGSRYVKELPHPSYERRKLLCKTAEAAVWVHTCTTHIDNEFPEYTQIYKDDQIRAVKEYVEPLANDGKRVVLMGDFNVEPQSEKLDRFYHYTMFGGGAHGIFEEVDQGFETCRCGAATHDRGKIDYTWVNNRDWDVLDGSVHNAITASDHHILRGLIRVNH